MDIKAALPWQAKIAAKLILSRMPVGYGFWQRVSLFKHGPMEQPVYAYQVFRKHFDRAGFSPADTGLVALEMGPGDSLFSALCAYALGASDFTLVDVGPFARDDLRYYRAMADYLAQQGLPTPDMTTVHSLPQLLTACRARYLTTGLASLRSLPDQSVDFLWSHAVLEHVRRHEFADMLRQTRRILRPGGVASHTVDLRDHLGGALNNLRFREPFWESDFMSRSGFYTNRIRYAEMLDMFRQTGFCVKVLGTQRWKSVPTAKRKLAAPFRDISDEDLCVAGLDVLLQ